MLDEFAPYGIEMVAISPDRLHEAQRMLRMSKLRMPLLCDPELEVIDLYGVRHEKGMGAPRDGKMIRPLAIPTTVLIDGSGIVRWIDQADDYRVRANPARVLAAVREHLAPAS